MSVRDKRKKPKVMARVQVLSALDDMHGLVLDAVRVQADQVMTADRKLDELGWLLDAMQECVDKMRVIK